MALTIDWPGRVINSSASIPDLVAFHAELRDAEDGETGAIYPVTHTWKLLDLGGGAFFPALDLINGWVLKFPAAGNYTIKGNLGGNIIPVAGVYVERQTSAAYATTAAGGSGPSAADVATAVWQRVLEGLSAEEMMRVMLAALSGRTTGIGSRSEQYLSRDASKPRLTAEFDVAGNRTAVSLDGS